MPMPWVSIAHFDDVYRARDSAAKILNNKINSLFVTIFTRTSDVQNPSGSSQTSCHSSSCGSQTKCRAGESPRRKSSDRTGIYKATSVDRTGPKEHGVSEQLQIPPYAPNREPDPDLIPKLHVLDLRFPCDDIAIVTTAKERSRMTPCAIKFHW